MQTRTRQPWWPPAHTCIFCFRCSDCLNAEEAKRNAVYVVGTETLTCPISADLDGRWPMDTMAAVLAKMVMPGGFEGAITVNLDEVYPVNEADLFDIRGSAKTYPAKGIVVVQQAEADDGPGGPDPESGCWWPWAVGDSAPPRPSGAGIGPTPSVSMKREIRR
jgi:hypothetical protein